METILLKPGGLIGWFLWFEADKGGAMMGTRKRGDVLGGLDSGARKEDKSGYPTSFGGNTEGAGRELGTWSRLCASHCVPQVVKTCSPRVGLLLGLWSVLVSTETADICPESLMGKAWVTSFRLIAEVDRIFCTFNINYVNLVISTKVAIWGNFYK